MFKHKTSVRIFLLIPLLVTVLFPFRSGIPDTVQADPVPAQAGAAPSSAAGPARVSGVNVLDIPQAKAIPQIDGACDEYGEAVVETFPDGNGLDATVYIMYNGGNLYVCLKAQPGTFDSRFGALYLDPQGDGSSYVFAQQNDYSLRVNIPGTTRSSYHGSGVANGYVLDASLDGLWDGAATASQTGESVEYRVELGRFFLEPCKVFGLAVYHHWFSAVGDDYGWPSNQYFDQPRTWQLAQLFSPACADRSGKIAYVFRGNTADAISYYNLLVGAGYSVTLVPLGDVLTTDFTAFDLILVADDTGSLDTWGISPSTAAQVSQIDSANKPVIGLGEGGYAFFGRLLLFIGWPNGWHGPQEKWHKAAGAPANFFNTLPGDPVSVYASPVNSVGIYLGGGGLPGDVIPVGLEDPTVDHASLIMQNCRLLWGGSGNPLAMVADGKTLFLNAVAYMRFFQCPPPTPPPQDCITISKSANPPSGTPVAPGDVIAYTITYTYSNAPGCQNSRSGKLVDSVPLDTTYVPGSASDGISPGADGALVWTISPDNSVHTKSFRVIVSERQCVDQRQVNNRAGILNGANPPVISNVVTHPVDCPPVGFPTDQPMFAEDEISIHPYPLVVGKPSKISVRVSNFTSSDQPVTVAFQTSPQRFGIGLDFASFDTRSLTIPAHGSAIVEGTFVPVSSGHYCIQIVVTGPALSQPLVTQRNIDVTEELQPGTPDLLTFKVRNNSSATADITLVVDNTCPGWSASIINPAGGVLLNMAPGEIRDATLQVTPPNPVSLGSGCHIDVQGWIGDQMIGGIRKMDVPPVQLPTGVIPPWEEPEISLKTDPPVVNLPNQICVELQNPLGTSRTVTIEYAVADFGAGIPFTTVGTKTFTLPPNSLSKYCIDWTPAAGGTLHRCVLVTLKQGGYQDMRSQRNVDLVRFVGGDLGKLNIPFHIGNPDLVDHTLVLTTTVVGINPYWVPKILIDPGDPPPNILMGGQTLNLHLQFVPQMAAGLAPLAPPTSYSYGDVSKVEVTALLDGQPAGGITIELSSTNLYLPFIRRQ